MMVILICFAFMSLINSETLKWTGSGPNNLWTEPLNWNPFGIPTAQDDVTISTGNITIGTPAGATAKSIILAGAASLRVEGCSVSVGTGGVAIQDNAILTVEAGAGSFIVNGTVTVSSAQAVVFKTGSLGGTWKVSAGSSLDFVASGNAIWVQGSIIISGALSVARQIDLSIPQLTLQKGGIATFTGGHLYATSLTNNGVIVFQDETAQTGTCDGDGIVKIQSSTLNGRFNNVLVLDSSSSISGVYNSVTIAPDLSLSANFATITNVEGGVINAWSTLTLDGQVSLTGVNTYSNQPGVNLKGTGSIGWIHCEAGGITLLSSTGTIKVSDIVHSSGDLQLTTGTLSPYTFNASGSALLISSDFNLILTNSFFKTHVDLSGTITIPVNSILTSAGSHFAPVATSPLGKIVNEGTFQVAFGTIPTTLHQVGYSGSGTVEVLGSLDLEQLTANFNALQLHSATSRITGESLNFQYSSLSGPSAGKTISFFADSKSWTCTSPCGAGSGNYQSISIWVSA